MSTEIVDVLSNYDKIHVFTLAAFDRIFKSTYYNNALLKHAALTSTIIACYIPYFESVTCAVSLLWDLYIPHNATKSLLNYVNIRQNLKRVKGVIIHYVKYVIRSIMSFLYCAMYTESKKTAFVFASKQLIQI